MKKLYGLLTASACLGLVFASAPGAHALAALRYSTDGATWTTVQDNQVGADLGASGTILGRMNVEVAIGSWDLQVVVTLTKPVVGSAAQPLMEMSVTGNTRGGETTPLYIEFTDTDFAPLPTGFAAGIGGNLGGGNSVVYTTRGSSLNTQFGAGPTLTTIAGTGAPFSGSATSGTAGLVSPYSLTLSQVFTSGGAGVISTDASLTSIPDGGSSMMLLGSALSALALFGRSFRRKVQ